jgi:photosystem II stability/assembly factor-like uncharacterized protein
MRRLLIVLLSAILLTGAVHLILNNIDSKADPPRTSGAMKALNFWTRSRAYPQKDIPPSPFFKAFERKKHLSKLTFSIDDSVAGWQAMGPDNVPGRMISLAVNPENPNTLYAGSASGGLWRTFDATSGKNWHRVHTGYPVLGVMGISIDHADTNTIYIGTGEVYGYQRSIGGTALRTTRGSYGIGILKTTDGGDTWQKSLDWSYNQQRGVQCLRMNPLNNQSLFAATTEGIYKTTDAGDTWQLVLPVLMGQDILIHHEDTTKVLVSCGNLGSAGSGLYRSLDGGKNWGLVSGIPDFSGKCLLSMYQNDPEVIFASVSDSLQGIGLYKASGFGDSWTQVHSFDVPQYQGWFSHWVAVKPNDINQVVHAGVQIYKSFNGGSSLSKINGPHVDHHNFAIDPSNPNVLYIANDGGVYRSTNFGSSYQNIGYGLQTAQFYNGFSSSYTDSALAMGGLQDNNTVIYYGTKDWQRVIGGDGCWTAINAFNDNILYGEYQYNNMFKSTNRGLTFSSATNGINQGGAAFVAPFVISESNPSILYAGRRAVFKTTNGADSWFPTDGGSSLDGNPVLSMAIAANNPDYVFAGTAPVYAPAGIFRSTDGNTWEDVTGTLPDRYPMDLAVDPSDKNTVYVVFAGFGSGHVFKSDNAGNSWTDITGSLPDVPTLSIAIDPLNSNHIYVGNDLGVYVSEDAGQSWTAFTRDLPESVIAMDLSVSRANRNLRLATHGNGAYQRPLVYKPEEYLDFNLLPFTQTILVGDSLSFTAQITNFGTSAQQDTARMELTIFDDQDVRLYEELQYVTGLESGELVEINFENAFTPQTTGTFAVHFTSYGVKTESVSQPLEVIAIPSINMATVLKEFRPYEELSDGITLPRGDDVQYRINLPFDFEYDGFFYDKVQVSTNGWMEFGTGQDGTERGLSTADQIGQIGANENGRMASAARPSKALGPWWEDLNADGTGQLSYTFLGSSPDRVFIMQWGNMRAYYSEATTTRVNFQVRLYEGSNTIEYHYGPVTEGTFSGGDLGAMIGFKDHVGGDYHYYDIAAGGTGTAEAIRTDLSPLTDWPGPDSIYVIQTVSTGIAEEVPPVPEKTTLLANYPNPFNPVTNIRYIISATQNVDVSVYNLLGQKVRTLINKPQNPGTYSVLWDGRNDENLPVSSGIYLYVLRTEHDLLSRRMLLLK